MTTPETSSFEQTQTGVVNVHWAPIDRHTVTSTVMDISVHASEMVVRPDDSSLATLGSVLTIGSQQIAHAEWTIKGNNPVELQNLLDDTASLSTEELAKKTILGAFETMADENETIEKEVRTIALTRNRFTRVCIILGSGMATPAFDTLVTEGRVTSARSVLAMSGLLIGAFGLRVNYIDAWKTVNSSFYNGYNQGVESGRIRMALDILKPAVPSDSSEQREQTAQ